ncbi:hypothetical protein NLI96_g8663 [Meripilus lineatus]|uniref:Uncharacterized protein n=1 Tax=Meripilus lineatus TaxID=2056292 RepID=A0AAD5UX75_9APHY|nr:hypothetical protein NLI96_g8663 [Physisporinus lineatus]
MDYSSLFSSGLQAMASESRRRPTSVDASPVWTKQGPFPNSSTHTHERRPSLPLNTQRRMGIPSRNDTAKHPEPERVPRRQRSNSMISPSTALADVGDLWSTRENPVMYVRASSHLGFQEPKRKSISTSDIPSFMEDFDVPSPVSSTDHLHHHHHPGKKRLSDSFLSLDSPIHAHSRTPASRTPRSRRSSCSSTHSTSSYHTESTARGFSEASPVDGEPLSLEDCFDDSSDWRQTIDSLLVDNAALLIMLAGPGEEEELFM